MMTDEDLKVTTQALLHYAALCQPETYKSIGEIVNQLEKSKTLNYQNIPIVRTIMEQVKQRYIESMYSATKNNMSRNELVPIYRIKINAIDQTLAKL